MTIQVKQKQEALKRMSMLQLLSQVKKDFEKNDRVYYSERQSAIFNATLYWLDNHQEYVDLVKEFEKKTHYLVYHCQLTHTHFGDLLSLFYVSTNEQEWEMDKEDLKRGIMFVYVANVNEPTFNEYGTIEIKPSMGGVARVG